MILVSRQRKAPFLCIALLVVASATVARADARLEESGACKGVPERVAALVGRNPFVAESATTIAVVTERSAGSASGLLSISVLGRPAGHRAEGRELRRTCR